MTEVASQQQKEPFHRTWLGVLLLWPILLSIWIWKRENWSEQKRLGLIMGFWGIIFVTSIIFRVTTNSYDKGLEEGKRLAIKQSALTSFPTSVSLPLFTTQPTSIPPEPTVIPESSPTSELKPYIVSEIGRDVAGDNSNVSTFKNSDGSIDVINNIQVANQPPFGAEVYTRKWVTEFLSKSYTSGLKIRYVLVTISFLHSGNPATRVGLGINRAKIYSYEEWKEFTPYDLCNWLKKIQNGDNINPGDPGYDPSDWAFAKNYSCN